MSKHDWNSTHCTARLQIGDQHRGKHDKQVSITAGVVIADRPLVEHAPLYRDGPTGGPVVQYDIKSSESLGLIKFDFGLRLGSNSDALADIKTIHNIDIDMASLPTDESDPPTVFFKGDSVGFFS